MLTMIVLVRTWVEDVFGETYFVSRDEQVDASSDAEFRI